MKTFCVLTACVIGVCAGWLAVPVGADIIDQIVAILDGDLILLSEVREHAMNPAGRAVANLQQTSALEEKTLQYMIERQLLTREVQYLAVSREISMLKALALQYTIKRYHQQDAQAFSNVVQAAGITDVELEQEMALYMKGMDYIRRKHRFSENIDDPETVVALFEDWINELQTQASIQILL
jgi:hypothetical protein